MIFGIGTDIIEVQRIAKAVSNYRFLKKYFTEKEIQLFESKINSIAGNFAAKEAIAKAFGVGFREFWPIDIEILRDDLGKPCVNLYNKAREKAEESNINKIHVTLSHIEKYAIAYAIAETE